jgi:hypothetical protein
MHGIAMAMLIKTENFPDLRSSLDRFAGMGIPGSSRRRWKESFSDGVVEMDDSDRTPLD